MRLLGLVGDHALRSEGGFANMASVIANRADTEGWRTIAEEKITQLSQGGPDGLGALAQIDAELRQRTPDMSVATADALAGRIKAAVARLTADEMIAEIAAVRPRPATSTKMALAL